MTANRMKISDFSNNDLLAEIEKRQQQDATFEQQLREAVLNRAEDFMRILIQDILRTLGIQWSADRINDGVKWLMKKIRDLFK